VMFMGFNWYLIVDGSPLRQQHAKYRITKRGFIYVKEHKNMPHNEFICLSLTNGVVYIPLSFRIWTSKKITNKRDYKKKTELFSAMLYEYLMKRIPVKTMLFDNGFAAMRILQWLNNNKFTWFTRIKANKNVRYNGKKCHLEDLNLKIDKGIVLEMIGVKGYVKIIRICHQDEIVYIATNHTGIDDTEMIKMYRARWKCEVFHRDAKQHLAQIIHK